MNNRKEYNIKLPDAIIAATAFVNNLGVITRNKKDFIQISDLEVVDPHDL